MHWSRLAADFATTHRPHHQPQNNKQVEAEKVAWQLAEELGLDVVTILPNFVLVGVRER